ncbi:hypothetical protein ACO0KY_06685 [Undibacterium sp. Dicai25W]|uniref:hypothetical protein n=1 Tax=Undibacterium sp. Dicai25W TaxID=3413034 RepID=UPI003BF261E7
MRALKLLVHHQNKFELKKSAALLLVALFSLSAHATNELVLQMETSLSQSQNPFRYYDGQSDGAQIIHHQTDTVEGADIRVGVIIPVLSNDTKLMLTGSLGGRRYIHDDTLNHLQGGADADFQWVASKLLSGRINAGAGQHLFNYINGSLSQKDIEHDRIAGFDVNIKVTDSWWLMPKLFYTQLYYDLPINKLYDYKQDGRQLGLRYMSPTGSSVEGGMRFSTTNYTDRSQDQIEKIYDIPYVNSAIKPEYDTQFKETELYLDGEWQYSVKTTTSAHIGVIRRRYSTYSNLDTNLSNAIVRGTYRYTPQLRLDAQIFDQPFPIVDPTISYVVTKGVRFDALWLYSDKLQFNASAVMQNSSQVYIPGIVNLTGNASQVARMKRVGLGASYQIDRGFRLFADSYFERNRGDVATLNVSQSVIKIGVEYTYENLPGSAARMNLQRYQDYLSSSPAIAR